jgi:hypothetical protein
VRGKVARRPLRALAWLLSSTALIPLPAVFGAPAARASSVPTPGPFPAVSPQFPSRVAGESGLWIDRPLAAVEIRGLQRTRPLVVLREVSVHVGEPLDWSRLERDRLRLLDLGLFAGVDLVPRRDRALDRPALEIRVRERPGFVALPTLSWEEGQG